MYIKKYNFFTQYTEQNVHNRRQINNTMKDKEQGNKMWESKLAIFISNQPITITWNVAWQRQAQWSQAPQFLQGRCTRGAGVISKDDVDKEDTEEEAPL